MREMRMSTNFWLGSLKGTNNLEDLDMDGRIILEWILGTRVVIEM
jgi:hypothetical protein